MLICTYPYKQFTYVIYIIKLISLSVVLHCLGRGPLGTVMYNTPISSFKTIIIIIITFYLVGCNELRIYIANS